MVADRSDSTSNGEPGGDRRRGLTGAHRRAQADLSTLPQPVASTAALSTRAVLAKMLGRYRVLLCAAVILLAGLAAYWNSFEGQFLLDDKAFLQSELLARPFPPWRNTGEIGTRPLVFASLWSNYRTHGVRLAGYHAVNLILHLSAALVLMGLIRRTLLLPPLQDRFGRSAWLLAGAVALLWVVHPLCTSAVTYISQRAEVMLGLFYLLTLYFAVRGFSAQRATPWLAGSAVACLLGMLCKEVIVTAPLMVLLYDRLLASSSWAEVFRRRWRYYLALMATFVPLAVLLACTDLGQSVGFQGGKLWSFWEYARTQPLAILHYLRLSIAPVDLCLDYGWSPAAGFMQIVPPFVAVAAMLATTVWGLVRRSAWALAGAAFFLILAPSSSFLPLADLVFEHRMYLPLAAVLAAAVIGLYVAIPPLLERLVGSESSGPIVRPMGGVCLATAALVLGGLTLARNEEYRDPLRFWSGNLLVTPNNGRVYNSLGQAWQQLGELAKAYDCYETSSQLPPYFAESMVNAGVIKIQLAGATADPAKRAQMLRQAQEWCLRAIKAEPDFIGAYGVLGAARQLAGDYAGAEASYRQVLKLKPNHTDGLCGLADVLARQGKWRPAAEQCRTLLANSPGNGPGMMVMARLLAACPDDSIRNGKQALAMAQTLCHRPMEADSVSLDILALALAETGQLDKAVWAENRALDMMRHAPPELTRDFVAHLNSFQARRPFRGYP